MEIPRLPTQLHVIGGRRLEPATGQTFSTCFPGTGEEVAQVARGSREDVDRAVKAALDAFRAWRDLAPLDRSRMLRRLADFLVRHRDELALLDTLDCGRPITGTRRDVERSAEKIEFYAGFADKIRGSVVAVSRSLFNYTRKEPYGVVGAIVPWNYPLSQAVVKLAPILACGNTLVLKPAEQSPLSALRLGDLCLEAGIPSGVVNVVAGFGPEAGAALVEHPAVQKISFTGSTAVGREIMARGGIKSYTLELGGKTPNVVFLDADLEQALEASLYTVFNNSGQTCTAATRLLVQEAVADRFVDALIQRARELRVGDPRDPSTRIGPLVSREQRQRVEMYVAEGLREGATLALGGSRPLDPALERGFYFTPTIFLDVRPQMRIAQEEIFGPVLSVLSFADEDEAIALANGVTYGLAATIWTNDVRRAHRLAAEVEAGLVWVNTVHALHPASPYGGYKESGIGLEMGLEAADEYMKTKSVWLNLGRYVSPWAR